jgi:hypothetical protein
LTAVQSPSIDNNKVVDQPVLEPVDSEKSSTTSATTSTPTSEVPSEEQKKKKRYIEDDLLDDSDSDENNNNHVLHAKIQEISATIHDNADSKSIHFISIEMKLFFFHRTS